MMRTALVLLLVACGSKHGSKDCGAYATKFAQTIDAAPERFESMLSIAKQDCESGRVDDKMFQCVMAAKTNDDIMVCQGLTPLPH